MYGAVSTISAVDPPRARRYDPAETRNRVLEAAYLLFGTRGYEGTGTADVARAAGVSEGSIFYHFRSKQGLLAELGRLHGQKMIAAMQRDDRMEDISCETSIRRCFEFVETTNAWERGAPGDCGAPSTYQQMKKAPEGEVFLQASRGMLVAWTTEHLKAVAAKRGHGVPDPARAAAMMFAVVKEALARYMEPGAAAGERTAILDECVRFCATAVGEA